jgi:hypothetical protein
MLHVVSLFSDIYNTAHVQLEVEHLILRVRGICRSFRWPITDNLEIINTLVSKVASRLKDKRVCYSYTEPLQIYIDSYAKNNIRRKTNAPRCF